MTSEDIELSSDPKVVRIRKMALSVLSEIYHMRSFVRLKALANQMLYGYLKPRHKTGSDISRFFRQKIAINNNRPRQQLGELGIPLHRR